MNNNQERHEQLFELIKSLTKAEKRNFRLYATRLSGNQEAKFVCLFDHLDSADRYDEGQIIRKCPIRKEQLPNMKAHLYRQILVSLRLLSVQRSETMQLREQLDFAQILYDRGLYRQSERLLDKLKTHAAELESFPVLLESVSLSEKIGLAGIRREMAATSDAAYRRTSEICSSADAVGELSNISVRVYALYQQLGYARTQKDLDLITHYFGPRLEAYQGRVNTFREKFYFYQASAWYYYIQHNFVKSYRYSCLWVALFDGEPRMKDVMYDDYMKGCAQILEALYLMRSYKKFAERLDEFTREFDAIAGLNTNAWIISRRILYTNLIHKYFIRGEFDAGLAHVAEIDAFIERFSSHIDDHYKMLMNYKIACLYFGSENYTQCMERLARITCTKNTQTRRDLQCFSRILNLIASYEAGIDNNLDYQIRSVYAFLVKMNDMNAVQKEMLSFLKRLGSIYENQLKEELRVLYERLKPYENHPYERRTFYYLDIMSWLESKITGQSVSGIIQRKYNELRP